jgi:hypothetical protein
VSVNDGYRVNRNHSSTREDMGNCTAMINGREKECIMMLASSKERAMTRHVPRIGIPVGCTRDLNQFRKAHLVLVNIM